MSGSEAVRSEEAGRTGSQPGGLAAPAGAWMEQREFTGRGEFLWIFDFTDRDREEASQPGKGTERKENSFRVIGRLAAPIPPLGPEMPVITTSGLRSLLAIPSAFAASVLSVPTSQHGARLVGGKDQRLHRRRPRERFTGNSRIFDFTRPCLRPSGEKGRNSIAATLRATRGMPRAPDPGAKTNLRGVVAHAARWGGAGRTAGIGFLHSPSLQRAPLQPTRARSRV